MSTTLDAKIARTRMHAVSWGLWAERAVVRALEIDPVDRIRDGILFGAPVWQVALTIARSIGYLAGTQRAPDLPAELRAWIDSVGMCEGTSGVRLGSLSWSEWSERASIMALELDATATIAGPPLRGQHVWQMAVTIARAVACLADARRTRGLPAELLAWLRGAPGLAAASEPAAHGASTHGTEDVR